MKAKYETLDEYLDDLDKIKEKIAEETQGMTRKQVIEYFNEAIREFKQRKKKTPLCRPRKKAAPAKR